MMQSPANKVMYLLAVAAISDAFDNVEAMNLHTRTLAMCMALFNCSVHDCLHTRIAMVSASKHVLEL